MMPKPELTKATRADYPVIQNMARFYVYDMSRACGQLPGWECPEDGLYESFDCKRYFEEPDRHAFLITVDREKAGFVLIHKVGINPKTDWNMGEFFILAKFQGKGIGECIAAQIFEKFPGTWEISVIPENTGALPFWRKVILKFTGGTYLEEIKHVDYDKDQPKRYILSFDTKTHARSNETFTVPAQPLTMSLPARKGTRVVTSEFLLGLPQESTNSPIVRWLDNTQLLYAYPSKQDNQGWTIESLNIHTGERKVLGEGTHPIPSPDGQWIAFTRGIKEEKQLWLIDSDRNNAKQLSYIQGGLGEYYQHSFDYAWSPDSREIALSHKPDVPYWEKKPQPKSMLDIITIKTGSSKQIAAFDEAIRNVSWLPNGEELVFMKERIGFLYNEEEDRAWIQALHIKEGALRTLAAFEGVQQCLTPTASPNGKWVAFMYDADNPMFNHMTSLGLVSTDPLTSENTPPSITRLTHEVKLYSPRWSFDSQRIYVRRDHGAYRQIYAVDSKTGELSQITNAPLNIESYALSPDGSHLVWIGQDAQATRIIRIASSDGHNVRDLATLPAVLENMALSEVREIDWKTPDYPTSMRGLLFMPLNYQKGTRYPLIVDIHGGGEGAQILLRGGILNNTPLEWHMWAAKGYAVFVPEFRSSASFGSLAITRDALQDHDLVNCDIKDIEAGIDVLINQGIVDDCRLAVIGYSAGARRANWLTATRHRFKAVVSKDGWADDWIELLNGSPSIRIYQAFGGAPWEAPENYLKNSALFHCNGATTPTLFLMGNPELGAVDRYNTVYMLYNALKGQGIDTEHVKYSDEGHVFEKSENLRDALERSIKWIDGHLGKG